MDNVDVVYLYEHAARELDVACAIAAILQHEHGLSVRIVHWPSEFSRVEHSLQPRLVVLPYCYAEENYTFLLAKWRTSIFLNAAWEQLLYSGNLVSKTPHGPFAIQHVFHHSWSAQNAGFLQEQGIAADHIFVNGQPGYALYEEPYKRYFTSRAGLAARHALDAARKWILFSENYNWAFYSEVKLAYFIAQGKSAEEVYAMRDFCKRSLAETVQWCARLARAENVEVILRPRPSTLLDEFFAVIQEIVPEIPPHLHIIQDENIREWILASEVVVSSYSTTLIEAALAGKPVYMLEPYPIPESLQVSWHALLPHLRAYAEFQARCLEPAGPESALGQWARRTLLAQGDPIGRLAKFIAQLLRKEMQLAAAPSWKTIVPIASYRRYIRLRKLYRRIRYSLGIPKIEPVPPVYGKDIKSAEEIGNRIQRWLDLLYVSPKG